MACADSAAPTGSVVEVAAALGNAQVGPPDLELPEPIGVRLRQPDGAPRVGVPIAWEVPEYGGGGTIRPLDAVTNDSGVARAAWTLGSVAGRQYVNATADSQQFHFRAIAGEPLTFGQVRPLQVPPVDGSDEYVHPDAVRTPRGWGPARRFLAITTYPSGDIHRELPSVFASSLSAVWDTPAGLSNPVARPSGNYLSDPDIVFEPDRRELWLYYRGVKKSNTIMLKTSADGLSWSAPVAVISEPNHRVVSPTVVRAASGEWHMWSVNAGAQGCDNPSTTIEHRTSTDGLHWSVGHPVQLGDGSLLPWHVDVIRVAERNEYWAIFNAKPPQSCSTPAVYLATSTDGNTWTVHPRPVLSRGAITEFEDIVYRASLEYDPVLDAVTIWYSGARFNEYVGTYIWRAAVQRVARPTLFDRVRGLTPDNAARRPMTQRRAVPALHRAP